MTKHPHANSHRDLIVYRKALLLSRRIFEISRGFPREEMYSLTDQIRRSSRSIGAQIAEAWAKRRYEKHFISKLTDTDGEQNETQHWLEVALDCGYLEKAEAQAMIFNCMEIGRLIGGMIKKSDLFCKEDYMREPFPDYFIDELHDSGH
jgi:four helix bundle protein